MNWNSPPAGNHTAFMYIEDDDLLLWEAVLAWAQDEAPLAELGYMRAFARTETSNPKGESTGHRRQLSVRGLSSPPQLASVTFRLRSAC